MPSFTSGGLGVGLQDLILFTSLTQAYGHCSPRLVTFEAFKPSKPVPSVSHQPSEQAECRSCACRLWKLQRRRLRGGGQDDCVTYCIDCLCDTEAALVLLGATLLMVFFRLTIACSPCAVAPRDLRASKRMGPISFLAGCRKRRLP